MTQTVVKCMTVFDASEHFKSMVNCCALLVAV
jgi:hypothetical protein